MGRESSKGFKDERCRLCGEDKESLEHIWVCQKARETIKEEWVKDVEEKGLAKRGEGYRNNLIEVLKGEPIIGICKYSREFEERARKVGKEGQTNTGVD